MYEWLPYITSTLFTVVTFTVAYLRFVRNREKVQEEDRISINTRVKILEERFDPTIPHRVSVIEGQMVLCAQHSEALRHLPQMQQDIATLSEQGRVYWEVIAPKLRDIIHSPVHRTRDALVDLLVADKIQTLEQAQTLEDELEQLWAETDDPGEQVASAIFLARTKWLLKRLSERCQEESLLEECHDGMD
jgi:hypothetical protein